MEKRGVTAYHEPNIKSADYNPYEEDLMDKLSGVVKDKRSKNNEQQSIHKPTSIHTSCSKQRISRSL